MLKAIKSFEVWVAGILPGLKTKITLALGIVLGFASQLTPELLAPVVPVQYQGYIPLVLMLLAAEFHRMHDMH